MDLFESSWFLISSMIILIVVLIDPKNSIASSSSNGILGLFKSRSSGQQFIYNFNSILILVFFVLSILLSLFS
jgi:preprotein translocase subunit SecG